MPDFKDFTLIDGKPIRFQIRRSNRARRLSLHVTAREGLVVVLPRRMAAAEVDRAITANAGWIDEQVSRFGVRHGPVRREYANGGNIRFLGRVCYLDFGVLEANRKRSRVWIRDDIVHGRFTPEDLLSPRPVLERWLRRRAREVLVEIVDIYAGKIGVRPKKIIIGERTSRWGSCSSSGNLSFCYRLVMAPRHVVEAIVCHELCHLRHLNHGPAFQHLLREVCTHYDECMGWLKENERELIL